MWGTKTESAAQRYLRSAPSGERKDILSAVCVNRVVSMPAASASEFGEPVTDTYGLEPVTEVIRDVLQQDRSMYAWVARTCMVFLDSALITGPGDWSQNLATAMEAVGFEPGSRLRADLTEDLPEHILERINGLYSYCMAIFWAVARPEFDSDRDRTVYKRMFESPDPRTELTAHDVAAWACVIIGRLRNRNLVGHSPLFGPDYQSVPMMDDVGWYPNPYNSGELVNGEPDFQRFWNGHDWTDRIRLRRGRKWAERVHSLKTAPNN